MEIDLPGTAEPEAVAALDDMLRALQAALRLPPAWTPELEAHVHGAFAAYDRYLAHATRRHPMSCRSGCTACCHDDPRGLSGLEQHMLRRWLDAQPDAADLRAAFADLARKGEGDSPDQWRRRKIPCPLLKNDRCRAYPLRPIACRAFHALTPAEWCDPRHPRYPRRVNPHLDPPPVLLMALKVLSSRLGLPDPDRLHRALAAPLSPPPAAPAAR